MILELGKTSAINLITLMPCKNSALIKIDMKTCGLNLLLMKKYKGKTK